MLTRTRRHPSMHGLSLKMTGILITGTSTTLATMLTNNMLSCFP